MKGLAELRLVLILTLFVYAIGRVVGGPGFPRPSPRFTTLHPTHSREAGLIQSQGPGLGPDRAGVEDERTTKASTLRTKFASLRTSLYCAGACTQQCSLAGRFTLRRSHWAGWVFPAVLGGPGEAYIFVL